MKLELSLHASKLKNVAGALRGTSDPFAVVTKLPSTPGAQAEVIGRTEVVKNNLSPQWVDTVCFDYELGSPLKIAVTIFDENTKRDNKSMGTAVFEVGDVLGSRGNSKAKRIKNGGTIYAIIRKSQGQGTFHLKMKGVKLKNVEGFFSKSDPFFEVAKKSDSGSSLSWDNVYRSKDIHNNLNPDWPECQIEVAKLCNGNLDLPLQITVYDHERSGKHQLMGKMETTANKLINAANSGQSLQIKLKMKASGTIIIQRAEVVGGGGAPPPMEMPTGPVAADGEIDMSGMTQGMAQANIGGGGPPPPMQQQQQGGGAWNPAMVAGGVALAGAAVGLGAAAMMGGGGRRPQQQQQQMGAQPQQDLFVDYVSGGCELNVCVAIDFTGSNGDPRKPGTLHYLFGGGGDPNQRNCYEKAIAAIVSILSKYDSDQMFPVYGFGAKYGGIVRHCFQCGPQLAVQGMQGVLDAYHAVFQSGLIMSGPTLFNEVIDTAAQHAQQALDNAMRQGKQAYTILLILTDGAVSDVNATAAAISRASAAPLSIVIVGIGNADFSGMQFLDDFNSAQFGGQARDIVQFVEFNRHAHNSVALTSETLDEIPQQMSQFFQSRGIPPGPALTRTDSTMEVENEDMEINLSLDVGSSSNIQVQSCGYVPPNGFAAV